MFKKIIYLLFLIAIPVVNLNAEIANFVDNSITSSPNNDNGVSLRQGSVPPMEGVELFVFNPAGQGDPNQLPDPPYETLYTIPFQVSEQPAVVVAIPGEIESYNFTENNSGNTDFPHTLTVAFRHSRYAGGVEADLPGPVGDFAIAIIPSDDEGMPDAMRGSYMATDASPNTWEIIPPSETSPNFGFKLRGKSGTEAFFDFFVPNSMIAYLSEVLDEALDVGDLALFNNNRQVSVDIIESEEGGLIEIDVKFNQLSDTVSPQTSEFAFSELKAESSSTRALRATRNVAKSLTVGQSKEVSITPSKKRIKANRKVRLFGWVKDGTPGKRVKILSTNAKKAGRRALIKRPRVKDDGSYRTNVRLASTDTFRAVYKEKGQKVKRSRRLRVIAK